MAYENNSSGGSYEIRHRVAGVNNRAGAKQRALWRKAKCLNVISSTSRGGSYVKAKAWRQSHGMA